MITSPIGGYAFVLQENVATVERASEAMIYDKSGPFDKTKMSTDHEGFTIASKGKKFLTLVLERIDRSDAKKKAKKEIEMIDTDELEETDTNKFVVISRSSVVSKADCLACPNRQSCRPEERWKR